MPDRAVRRPDRNEIVARSVGGIRDLLRRGVRDLVVRPVHALPDEDLGAVAGDLERVLHARAAHRPGVPVLIVGRVERATDRAVDRLRMTHRVVRLGLGRALASAIAAVAGAAGSHRIGGRAAPARAALGISTRAAAARGITAAPSCAAPSCSSAAAAPASAAGITAAPVIGDRLLDPRIDRVGAGEHLFAASCAGVDRDDRVGRRPGQHHRSTGVARLDDLLGGVVVLISAVGAVRHGDGGPDGEVIGRELAIVDSPDVHDLRPVGELGRLDLRVRREVDRVVEEDEPEVLRARVDRAPAPLVFRVRLGRVLGLFPRERGGHLPAVLPKNAVTRGEHDARRDDRARARRVELAARVHVDQRRLRVGARFDAADDRLVRRLARIVLVARDVGAAGRRARCRGEQEEQRRCGTKRGSAIAHGAPLFATLVPRAITGKTRTLGGIVRPGRSPDARVVQSPSLGAIDRAARTRARSTSPRVDCAARRRAAKERR